MAGKHAVVVGGTSGIGHGIALRLAQAGCSVTIVGRSASRGVAIVERMATTTDEQKHAFLKLDAFSLKACGTLAEQLGAADKPLDLLVLSQGMATLQKHTPVAETGLDQKLTLHVYSRALLASALAPVLARSPDPRVLSVLSAGIHGSYEGASPELLKGYSITNAANAAGAYNDAYLEALSEKHPKVSFLHASPGFVNTNWGTEMPTPVRWLIRGMQYLGGRSKEACGEYLFKGLYRAAVPRRRRRRWLPPARPVRRGRPDYGAKAR
jgi:NAD(P)-dependent dehydrogenase (short-subunit alcohol dehydrogenase family)